MGRRRIKLPGLTGNGSNGTMSILLPVGLEYYNLWLVLASGTAAITTITDIKLFANSDMIWNLDGQDLDEINKFDSSGAYATANILRFPFEQLKFIDGVPRMSTSLNTGVASKETGKIITSARLQFDVTGATNPDFDVYADVEPADPAGPGFMRRLEKYVDDLVNGERQFKGMQFGDRAHWFWRRVFLKASTGTLSKVRIKWGPNNEERFECPVALNAQSQAGEGKTTGSYYGFPLDFTETNMPFAWDTMGLSKDNANSLQFLVTNSATATGTNILESLGELA